MAATKPHGMTGEDRPLMDSAVGINRQLSEALETAIERNAVLRIGWTADGAEVPKQGEGGLCPLLPEGARVRALGRLGAWVATLCSGSFDHRGDAGSYFGAAMRGGRVVCEGRAGNMAGWAMEAGLLTLHEGAGDDLGAQMHGGMVLARGHVGRRVGNGMQGGLIVIHGDVDLDPGCGMQGGMIVVDGRCPAPAEGVQIRPLTDEELGEVNANIDDPAWQVHADAVCLVARKEGTLPDEPRAMARQQALDDIVLVPNANTRSMATSGVDMSVLLGERPLALRLPVLPHVSSGKRLLAKRSASEVAEALADHPCIVESEPRPIDLMHIGKRNLDAWHALDISAGAVVDLDDLPPMDPEAFEGLLVVLLSLVPGTPVLGIKGDVARVGGLHSWAAEHSLAVAFMSMATRPELPVPAMLPMSGRSANGTLDETVTLTGSSLDWSPTGRDVAVLLAGGMRLVSFHPNDESPAALASTMETMAAEIHAALLDIGLSSVDALNRANLRAVTRDAAMMSGLRMAGFERPLPEWTR